MKRDIIIVIGIMIIIGAGYFIGQYFKSSERIEAPKIPEKIETPKTEEIIDNDLIMDAIRNQSNISSELLENSCVSSIMQEAEDLIVVYISWNCGDVGGGARAILKKDNSQYKFIAIFQDPPSCALMEEFSVPELFYETCYDNYGNVR